MNKENHCNSKFLECGNTVRNKKAVSALVAAVLLILITIAAAGTIWSAVMPMITKSMQLNEACLNAVLTIDTQKGYTCYSENTKRVSVMVERGAQDFSLSGIQISLSGDGKTKTYSAYIDPSTALNMPFDGDYGSIAVDFSKNGNNGTLNGFYVNDDPASTMLSQSGLAGFYANQVIDNNIGTNAWHTDSSIKGAYLAIDLGTGNEKAYTKARIYAFTSGYNGNYAVQYSDDNNTWTNASSTGFIPNAVGWNEKIWNNTGVHRYWRFYLVNTPGGGSWLTELEMYKDNFTYTQGKIGKALQFDGIDDYIEVKDAPTLDLGTNPHTVMAWIYIQNMNSYGPIAAKRSGGTVDFNYHISNSANDRKMASYNGATSVGGNTALNLNQWYHVAWVYDAGTIYFYVNGNSDGSAPQTSGNANNYNVFIGMDNGTTKFYFNGIIDEARIYNRSLSQRKLKRCMKTKLSIMNCPRRMKQKHIISWQRT